MEKNDSSYVEVPPPSALADCVLVLWEMRIPSAPGVTSVRILPNACVDIVLYASEPSRGTGDAQIVAPPHRSYVVGSTLRSFMVQSVGWRHIVGASLRPEGTQPLLGMPAGVIGESVAFLNDIIGPDAGSMEDFVLSGPASGVLRRFAEWLLGRRRASAPPDLTAHRAVALIHGASGRGRIDSVLDHLNVSARQLERKFLTHVGMPPKLFSRLVRFDRAVRGIPARGAMPWSQFALAYGYTDQSHFINEFREFAGVTPAEYEAGAH